MGFLPLAASQKNACPQNLCRPPRGFTHASPCPGLDHTVSGCIQATPGTFIPRPSLLAGLSLSLRLPFRLTLLLKCTPWHVIRNVRCNPEGPQQTITIRFQMLFTPSHGFFSTFPRGTCTLSVLTRI